MITSQEHENIKQGFDNIHYGINQLLSMCNLFEQKQIIIKQLISNRFSNEIQNFEINICNFLGSKDKIILLKKNFSSISPIESDITEHFKIFLFSEIVSFNPTQLHLLQPSIVEQIIELINRQNDTATNITPADSNIIIWIKDIPHTYLQYINSLIEKFTRLYIFNQLKIIQGNIVMIGANGSGKSTFARQLNGKLANNIVILSAQHFLYYSKRENISTSGNEIAKVRNFQFNTKLGSDSNFAHIMTSDMNDLVNALISEYTDCALECYKNETRKESYLSKTISLWDTIIEHRNLKNDRTGLYVSGYNIDDYDFNKLSDGEKAVFYYIGHILLAQPNSYIIVDEPENHLHLTICNKLWDLLERDRPDCKFIYLTHNLNFATTRTNSTILWNKSFIPPAEWNFEILPTNEIIPEVMIMELVGSRKTICFCEGNNESSTDYKLYSLLFPEYTVIPVSGHRDVIDYVNAYNSTSAFITHAVGIIDGDCHLPRQIEKWREKKIFVLPINEIENLLCDSFILKKSIDNFCAPEGALETFYSKFWKLLDENKTQLATWYVNNYINSLFKDNFLHEQSDIEALITELGTITSQENAKNKYEQTLEKINSYIQDRNYEAAIRFVNFKGRLTRDIAKNTIVDKYENRILDLIKKDVTLKDYLITTYFSDFQDLESN